MSPLEYDIRRIRIWLADLLKTMAHKIDPPSMRTGTSRVIPRSRLIKASFYFVLPGDATEAQVEEWLKYELNSSAIDNDNPLLEHAVETLGSVRLMDTRYHQHLRFIGLPGRFRSISSFHLHPYEGPTSDDILMNPDHPALERDKE